MSISWHRIPSSESQNLQGTFRSRKPELPAKTRISERPRTPLGTRILYKLLPPLCNCAVVTLLLSGSLAAQALPGCLPQGLTKLNADLQVRSDNNYSLADRNDIHRARAWLRPGFEMNPMSGLHFGARGSFALSTDQNQQNIPRFDNFHSNDISLDRLYLTVDKGEAEVCAGKFSFPFLVSEMLWDKDIQPSGIYAAFHRNWLSLRAGLFYRSHIHHDRSTIVAGQLNAQRQLKTNWGIGVVAGVFGFHNLDEFQPGMQRQNRVRLVSQRSSGQPSDSSLKFPVAYLCSVWRNLSKKK